MEGTIFHMKIPIFWDVTTFSLADFYKCFERKFSLHLQEMQAAFFSKISINVY
jgi:hypothetical protein